jgi:CMP-N-acetylneuraminic acid synthetase
MTMDGRRVLAVVPARGGSKGIPRKNLQRVAGYSLVARAAMVVRALQWLDAAVLSTDDEEIAEEGRRFGLAAPFLRPAELASDNATGVAAWRHAWLASEAHFGGRFDCSVLLQPTSPLRRPDQVTSTLTAMLAGGRAAAATVSRVPGHYVPEKLLRLDNLGTLSFVHPHGARYGNRQHAPAYYTRNGICYAARRDAVVDRQEIVERDCLGVLIDAFSPNIDDPIDLELADWFARTSPDVPRCCESVVRLPRHD